MKRGISTNRDLTTYAAALKTAGIDFVMRYYSRTTTQPQKRLTRIEADALSAAGLEIGVVYEDGPTHAAYFSTDRGHLDAVNACRAGLSLQQPSGSAIYFAVDFDATQADIGGAVLNYMCGVDRGMRDSGNGDSPYLIGVYGSGAVCRFLKTHCPFVRFAWLAESKGWLGSGTYADWDINQHVATAPLVGLTGDEHETNDAQADFGAFVLPFSPVVRT